MSSDLDRLIILGQEHAADSHFEAAVQTFRQALRLSPSDSATQQALLLTYLEWMDRVIAEEGGIAEVDTVLSALSSELSAQPEWDPRVFAEFDGAFRRLRMRHQEAIDWASSDQWSELRVLMGRLYEMPQGFLVRPAESRTEGGSFAHADIIAQLLFRVNALEALVRDLHRSLGRAGGEVHDRVAEPGSTATPPTEADRDLRYPDLRAGTIGGEPRPAISAAGETAPGNERLRIFAAVERGLAAAFPEIPAHISLSGTIAGGEGPSRALQIDLRHGDQSTIEALRADGARIRFFDELLSLLPPSVVSEIAVHFFFPESPDAI